MKAGYKIPKEIEKIAETLTKAGFQAYLVGGCLRDLLLGTEPKDWDIATNAKPEEVQKFFADSVYENSFGTVGVKTESEDPKLKIIEITSFRLEGKYTDKRHPDEIKFAKTIEEDLARRDFTVNALAMDLAAKEKIVDLFGGMADLKNKTLRAVGNAEERFSEDALRLLRAVRFSAQLGFEIEAKTLAAIKNKAGLLEFISKERIRDEFSKMIMTPNACRGVDDLQALGLLKFIVPELALGIGCEQNKHHIYDVFEHNLRALEYSASKDLSLEVRLASLFHDVGKPESRRWADDPRGEKTQNGKKGDWTFYQHQYIGEKLVLRILDRLRFAKEIIEKVALLVREHMFVYDPEAVTERGVRRLVSRVGAENVDDLLRVREADRIGSGVPKAQPYRLRHLKAMIEKAKKDPISPKLIKMNGTELMEILKIQPGPKVGQILSVLLEEVLDNPELNEKEILTQRVQELNKLAEKELQKLAGQAKVSAREEQERIDGEIKKKFFV